MFFLRSKDDLENPRFLFAIDILSPDFLICALYFESFENEIKFVNEYCGITLKNSVV